MANRVHRYFIRVFVLSETVPFSFFCLAEKKELAFFETADQAQEFLDTVKLKSYWEYSIRGMLAIILDCWNWVFR